MMCAIVVSFPPSPRDGCANSMGFPFRSSPLARSKSLIYFDAVFRFSGSDLGSILLSDGSVVGLFAESKQSDVELAPNWV